jgi:hypothetical protein
MKTKWMNFKNESWQQTLVLQKHERKKQGGNFLC